jgi:hypothetical protein
LWPVILAQGSPRAHPYAAHSGMGRRSREPVSVRNLGSGFLRMEDCIIKLRPESGKGIERATSKHPRMRESHRFLGAVLGIVPRSCASSNSSIVGNNLPWISQSDISSLCIFWSFKSAHQSQYALLDQTIFLFTFQLGCLRHGEMVAGSIHTLGSCSRYRLIRVRRTLPAIFDDKRYVNNPRVP